MGVGTAPKTKRNLQIYKLHMDGKTRVELMKRFNISERRFYQIIAWARPYFGT